MKTYQMKPTLPPQSSCRSCGAAIYWALNDESKKSMPVDVEPCDDGNIGLVWNRKTGHVTCHVLRRDAMESYDGPRRKSHFATCPNADHHRRAA